MLIVNNKALKITNKWLNPVAGSGPTPPGPTPPGPSIDEVTIGTQTWMAKNLAIDDGGEGIYSETVNYGQGDVVEYYYTWPAAVRVAASIDGWHLPSKDEWSTLFSTVGASSSGIKLMSTYGWTNGNGTDNYDFAVFPAGSVAQDYGYARGIGDETYFWTATEDVNYPNNSYYELFLGTSLYHGNFMNKTYYKFPVRLVKDAEPTNIEPGYISQDQYYAGWYKSQLDAVGGTYNSTYKFVSDNMPTVLYVQFAGNVFDSNYITIVSPTYTTASDNYTFRFSDILTETQYNNMYMFNTGITDGAFAYLIPSDLKLQLIS